MLFPDLDEDTIFVHRSDANELLGVYSDHPIILEGTEWPTVEHYFQAMKFFETNKGFAEKIRNVKSPKQARRLGRQRFKGIRKDWSNVKRVIMTRGVYTKCKAYPQVAQVLLETGNAKIMEGSQYDYYWGCGRDRRAENVYGKVLMDVRKKLQEELKESGEVV